jgi:uncharacterized membrane protein YeaQ/YmgE (transglycosylase-associated protein family)
MAILAWVVLGLLAGSIGSKIVNKTGEKPAVGHHPRHRGRGSGRIFNQFGHVGVTGLNLYRLLVAVVGAVMVLAVWHAIRHI